MSKWTSLFAPTILKRGLEYYNAGRVRELTRDNNEFSATIMGTDYYYVDITLDKSGNVKEAECNCPYADDGNYCKHIAAVLYKIEDDYGKEFAKEKKAEDAEFKEVKNKKYEKLTFHDDGRFHYLNFGSSLDIYKPSAQTYKKALVILDKFLHSTAKVNLLEEDGERYLRYEMRIAVDSDDIQNVMIKLGHDGIECISCTTDSWYIKKIPALCKNNKPLKDGTVELCIHKTIGLMCLIKFIENNRDIIDFTDTTAMNLISNFRKEKKTIAAPVSEAQSRDVDITAHIEEKSSYRPTILYFKVLGENGKYYKVGDIPRLYDAYKDSTEYTLNAKCHVDFRTATLTDRAVKSLEFIKTCIFNSRMGWSSIFHYGYKNEISFENMIDEFYEIMNGTTVFYDSLPLIGFKDVDPVFNMKIDAIEKEGEAVGIKVSGNISGRYTSSKYIYWIEGGYLKRAERSKLGAALALSSATNSDGEFSFSVGMRYIDNFYQRVLPELRRYGKIEDNAIDRLEGKLDEPPVAAFYLDIEENGYLSCTAKLRYKDKEENVTPFDASYSRSRFKDYIRDLCENLDDIFHRNYNSSKWLVYNSDEDMFTFFSYGVPALMELGEVNATDAVKNIVVRKMPDICSRVDIDENDDSILNFELDTQGLSIEELVAILKSYQDKKRFHRLKDGSFINLENTNLDSLRELFASMNISIKDFVDGKMHLPLYRALYLEQILQEKNGITGEGGAKYRKLIKEFKTINESDFDVPESLDSTMRSYQKDGYRWMRVLFEHGFGGILADDMGLGKTLQTLSMLLALKDEGKEVHALIVTPASLVFNWKAEAAKFTPSLKVATVSGSTKERKELISSHNDYDLLITSYDLLKRDIALYEGAAFNIEIIDEAQFIKNHNTAAAKSVRAIKSKHRLALTGTPIENRLSELWSIFEYLMPGFMYSQEQFRKFIANPIEKYKDQEAAAMLKRLTGPFILRRIKSDVLKDLPDKIEEIRVTPLSGDQLKLYIAEVAKTQGMLKREKDISDKKIEILAELMKIREICCDPSLVYKDYKGESAKREATLDLIKSAIDGGHKILLFSQFTSMLALLEEDLKEEGISYYKITGDTGKAKRLELVEAFNNGDVPLFLISLKAGGTGLNLTAADIVIHYDPWWNVAVQNQATDRAHRIGQTKRVTVYKMIAENTIEERIVKMQENKKDLANAIISTENMSLSSLTKEDLMELLSLSSLS